VLELERLVVEADGLVELSAQVVDEPHRKIGLRVGGVKAHALLQVAHCRFVLLELAAGVRQVGQHCFHHPIAAIGVAQRQRLQVASLRLLVVLLLVVDHSQLGVDQRVRGIYLLGLAERNSGSFEVVGAQILHAHVKVGLRAAGEKPDDGAIDGHGLV